jgi:hypothetical protein
MSTIAHMKARASRHRTVIRSVAAALLISVIPTQQAFAYVDPNIGGWLFQLLFPLFAAVLAIWAFIRNRIASAWRSLVAGFRDRLIRNDRSVG